MKRWIWLALNNQTTNKEIIEQLLTCKISGVHVSGDLKKLNSFCDLASEFGLKTNIWFWTLINTNREIAEKHPDWFNVSRKGNSSLTHPPYVGYYKWFCPNKIEVQEYLLNKLEKLCKNTSVNGIHLDYIRYPDVILPEAIQPEYGLVQNSEEPQFDFCYCETCRELYKKETGNDPLELRKPENEPTWLQFRLESINRLVDQIAARVYSENKKLTAAVFPHPEVAVKLVRQDWTKWKLDAVFPMIYYKFYNKTNNWISEIIKDLRAKYHYQIPIYPGIYLPDMTYSEYERIEDLILINQLPGLSLFDHNSLQRADIRNKLCNQFRA